MRFSDPQLELDAVRVLERHEPPEVEDAMSFTHLLSLP